MVLVPSEMEHQKWERKKIIVQYAALDNQLMDKHKRSIRSIQTDLISLSPFVWMTWRICLGVIGASEKFSRTCLGKTGSGGRHLTSETYAGLHGWTHLPWAHMSALNLDWTLSGSGNCRHLIPLTTVLAHCCVHSQFSLLSSIFHVPWGFRNNLPTTLQMWNPKLKSFQVNSTRTTAACEKSTLPTHLVLHHKANCNVREKKQSFARQLWIAITYWKQSKATERVSLRLHKAVKEVDVCVLATKGNAA